VICRWSVTDAAELEGAISRDGLPDKTSTASPVWAGSAYRSKVNETFLAEQKQRMGVFVRTVDLASAEPRIAMAN